MTETGCTCKVCVRMCAERPCWPEPKEAQAIIDAGFSQRLMRDYWVGDGDNIDIISPAIVGYEGQNAPFWPAGRCTFLSADDLCELHELGLKPREGREAFCKEKGGSPPNLHHDVAMTWDSDTGRTVAQTWKGKE